MNIFFQDIRYGLRMLGKNPGFTFVAVLTLALGIGATSIMFSFANGMLLCSLPYKDSDRLVIVDENSQKRGVTSMGVSYPNFLDWREQNQVFSGIASYLSGNFTITGGGEPEQLTGTWMSYDTFEVLGISPLLGRSFTAEEDRPEHDNVVILSHGLWQRRFGADPSILGQTIILNSRSRTVIGVMPPDFKFPDTSELWAPLALTTESWTRNDHGLSAVARLNPGVTLNQAQENLNAVALRIEELNPVTNEGMGVTLISLHEGLVSDYRIALVILMGVVGLVLAVACANVANLLLARASGRHKEMAIRTSLGASRWRIFRQLLTESFMLGIMGGAAGLLLAFWGVDLLLAAIPIEFPFWMKFQMDTRIIAFTTGISLLTGLVFGTAPALHALRVDLNETLKEGGRGLASASRNRLRRILVIVEVALSLILLIGAGLMIRSFMHLMDVNPGLNPENVLTVRLGLPGLKYNTPEKRHAFFKELTERVGALPGVQSSGAISGLPLSGNNWGRSLTVEGFPVLSVGQAPSINHCVVTPNYFQTMGIPMVAGRDFTDADSSNGLKVTIIDERLAREYWPNESAIGKRVRFGPPEANEPWHTVVGVVGEVKHQSLILTQRRSVYLPHAQVAIGGMSVVLHTSTNPESLIAAIRSQVKEMDADLPVTNVRTMKEVISRSVWQSRFFTILFGIFAAIALLLASVGIYGVMAYSVSQRTQEIGIRLALGAQKRDVMKMVVRQGMTLSLVGTAVGLAGALALTRLMESLLFEISTTDPLTFTGLALTLMAVSLAACWIPARRATKVDPIVALRYE
jgi:putative ABC transport system permease protein